MAIRIVLVIMLMLQAFGLFSQVVSKDKTNAWINHICSSRAASWASLSAKEARKLNVSVSVDGVVCCHSKEIRSAHLSVDLSLAVVLGTGRPAVVVV